VLPVPPPVPTEEAAAKKKTEEESATTGHVSLDDATIRVHSAHEAAIKLTCTGNGTCSGKLTLTAKSAKGDGSRRGEKTSSATTTLGSAKFSISAGTTTTAKLTLNALGRALLKADHGRLSTNLTIFESSPAPSQTHTKTVNPVQQTIIKVKQSTR
jgi:hypothetical protein